jgi:hypothetical protein
MDENAKLASLDLKTIIEHKRKEHKRKEHNLKDVI